MTTPLNISKIAPNLSGKERAKLVIAHWHSQLDGKKIFNEADELTLLNISEVHIGVECWRLIELYRWSHVLWTREIERVWQVLLLIFQNIATLRTLPTDISEHSFIMFDLPQMRSMAELHLGEFAEYQQAIAEIEKEGDGLPLFDETTYSRFREWFNSAKEFTELWNTWANEFDKDNSLQIADPKPRDEYVRNLVNEVTLIAKLLSKALEKGDVQKTN